MVRKAQVLTDAEWRVLRQMEAGLGETDPGFGRRLTAGRADRWRDIVNRHRGKGGGLCVVGGVVAIIVGVALSVPVAVGGAAMFSLGVSLVATRIAGHLGDLTASPNGPEVDQDEEG